MEVRGHGVRTGSAPPPATNTATSEAVTKDSKLAAKAAVKATFSPRPSRPPTASAASKATAAVNVVLPYGLRHSRVELSLVDNLKKQIGYLEAQVVCLKRQQAASATGASAQSSKRPRSPRQCITVAPEDISSNRVNKTEVAFTRAAPAHHTELAALRFNLERALADVDALHAQMRHTEREKSVMADEIAELRVAVRVAEQRASAAEAEREAALDALDAEQTGRRLLEEQLAATGSGSTAGPAASSTTAAVAPELRDVLHQKEYYKVQTDRLTTACGVLTARAGALEASLDEEHAKSRSTECALCAALDHVEELTKQAAESRVFYAKLGARYVATAAMLCAVLEAARSGNETSTSTPVNAAAAAARMAYDETRTRIGGEAAMAEALASLRAFEADVIAKLPEALPAAAEPTPAVAASTPQPSPPPPPTATVPPRPPPAAAVPQPIPALPAAEVPSAQVLSPPGPRLSTVPPVAVLTAPATAAAVDSSVDPLPPPAAAVPAPAASVPTTALQKELAALEARIASEEASLSAFVASAAA